MSIEKYYKFDGTQYTCTKCSRTFNEEGRFLKHYFCSHFKDSSMAEKAEYYKLKKSSLLNKYDVSIDAIKSFIEPTEGNFPKDDPIGAKFASYYRMITLIREYDCVKDTERFFNTVLPYKLSHPKLKNSKELCTITFGNDEEGSKLYEIMKSSNPFTSHDKTLSPFSKDFVGYKDLSDKEKTQKIHEAIKVDKKDKFKNQLGYWLKKGYTEEEAKNLVSDRQNTGSLQRFQERYGEEEGLKRFNERQEKWHRNYKKQNFSEVSQELFAKIYERIKDKFKNIYFARLDGNRITEMEDKENHEYKIDLERGFIRPDFLVEDVKKIIEFDGEYWHRFRKKRDDEKDEAVSKLGYEIFHVKEFDYLDDPDGVLKECLEFVEIN